MTSTRQETLRSELDALHEENDRLKESLESERREVNRLEETLRRQEQEMELACFRAAQEERRRGEEKEARLLALLERQVRGGQTVAGKTVADSGKENVSSLGVVTVADTQARETDSTLTSEVATGIETEDEVSIQT